jgi:hypothetical protein
MEVTMIYVAVNTIHSHLSQQERMAGFARRAEWKWPQGIKVIGEWWRAAAPQIITVFEADSFDPILAVTTAWGDFFEIDISPATTPEAGLAAAQKMMKK